ncbi:MAG: Fe-S protein assembly co-chaperone HscB [Phycisphaeraceae bacterium]
MNEHDPFEILGFPRSFTIDEQAMRQAFLKASTEHHPDRFTDPLEQADAVQHMSLLTDSYRVLSDPELRAKALLRLSGLELPEDKDKLPPALLMEVMEVREELEDAITSDDQSTLNRLRSWANEQRDAYLQKVGTLLDETLDADKAKAVRVQLNALRYMQRMLEQMPE